MSKQEQDHWAFEFGTDAQYLHWLSFQQSVLDSDFNQYNPERNIACHVRRLKLGAGRGIKPPFSAVSMTHRQHMIQEGTNGEVRAIFIFRHEVLSPEEAAQWFEDAAEEQLINWMNHRKYILSMKG